MLTVLYLPAVYVCVRVWYVCLLHRAGSRCESNITSHALCMRHAYVSLLGRGSACLDISLFLVVLLCVPAPCRPAVLRVSRYAEPRGHGTLLLAALSEASFVQNRVALTACNCPPLIVLVFCLLLSASLNVITARVCLPGIFRLDDLDLSAWLVTLADSAPASCLATLSRWMPCSSCTI